MGELVIQEGLGLRIESTLGAAERRDSIGAEAGLEFHRRPSPDCVKSHYYSNDSPLNRSKYYKEYIACRPYTFWALSFSAGAMTESGRDEGAPTAFGFNGGLSFSFNWTRPEKLLKAQLDGSDSRTFYPLRLGIGPVGQYSSLQGFRGGLAACVTIAGHFYLSGGVLFGRDANASEFLALGLKDLF